MGKRTEVGIFFYAFQSLIVISYERVTCQADKPSYTGNSHNHRRLLEKGKYETMEIEVTFKVQKRNVRYGGAQGFDYLNFTALRRLSSGNNEQRR